MSLLMMMKRLTLRMTVMPMMTADLYHDAPSGLHGHRDEGDDGVRQGEVEDEEVHVGPRHQVHPGTKHSVKLLIYAKIS